MLGSLDTNSIIHFYESGMEHVLHSMFDRLIAHEHIVHFELPRHCDISEIPNFIQDINSGYITVYTEEDLKKNKELFRQYNHNLELLLNLFTSADLGEKKAIAIAQVFDAEVLLTDDTKLHGPHDYCKKGEIPDVMGLAFYEILFLKYIILGESTDDYIHQFNAINDLIENPLNPWICYRMTLVHFWGGKQSQEDWVNSYFTKNSCTDKGYIKRKMKELERDLHIYKSIPQS